MTEQEIINHIISMGAVVKPAGWLRRKWLYLWVTGDVKAMKGVFSTIIYVDGATPEQLKTDSDLRGLWFHEKCHVYQHQRDGMLGFQYGYTSTFMQSLLEQQNCRRAYLKVKYEQEARDLTKKYMKRFGRWNTLNKVSSPVNVAVATIA